MRRFKGCLKSAGVMAVALALIVPAAFCADTIAGKGYYAVVLERRNAALGASVDALVLTPAGSGYRFIRRLDEDYRLILNATSDRQAPGVTSANAYFYEAMIKADHLTPRTIRDNNGRELAVVYCGLNPCYIDHRIRPDGTVLLDVKGRFFADPGLRGVFGRARVTE
jgi:hypothetical protein